MKPKKYLLDMIENGQIFASINKKDGNIHILLDELFSHMFDMHRS